MKRLCIYRDDDGNTVEFVREKRTPGFSHRVAVNGQLCDWLSDDFPITAKCAQFYVEKHVHRTL